MRVKSTGLGPTELTIKPERIWIKRVGGFLILHMESDTPIKWHLRTVFTHKDIWRT